MQLRLHLVTRENSNCTSRDMSNMHMHDRVHAHASLRQKLFVDQQQHIAHFRPSTAPGTIIWLHQLGRVTSMGFPRTAPPPPQLLPLLLLCGMCSWGLAQELACDSTGENCVGSNAADVLTYEDPTHGTPNAGESDNPGGAAPVCVCITTA